MGSELKYGSKHELIFKMLWLIKKNAFIMNAFLICVSNQPADYGLSAFAMA